MGKFGSRHKFGINCVILESLEYIFPFLGDIYFPFLLLEHWNSIFSLFGGYSMRAQWVNLEVPINCVILEHWNSIFFLFGITLLGPNG